MKVNKALQRWSPETNGSERSWRSGDEFFVVVKNLEGTSQWLFFKEKYLLLPKKYFS